MHSFSFLQLKSLFRVIFGFLYNTICFLDFSSVFCACLLPSKKCIRCFLSCLNFSIIKGRTYMQGFLHCDNKLSIQYFRRITNENNSLSLSSNKFQEFRMIPSHILIKSAPNIYFRMHSYLQF